MRPILKWIPVDKQLPKHHDVVLTVNNRQACAVTIFVDNEQMFQQLMMQNVQIPIEQRHGYEFCSQEIQGNVLTDVTHWAYIPRAE